MGLSTGDSGGFGRFAPTGPPADITSFVGRKQELARIAEALGHARLVTLTGPGGVGKTRTAMQALRGQEAVFRDGVHVVLLSALTDPDLLPATVAAVLDLPEQTARPAVEVLTEYLARRQVLLVLDTCEHLVDACARLVDLLLGAAPGLQVLTTSRQPLDVPGEHVLTVPPLAVNEEGSDAVRLFADRAAAAVPGFSVTEQNKQAVLLLCRRLDGIPLAIELAVTRLRVLSLEEILARLDQRFQLLSGRRRVTLPRHETLRTTIDWSYDLCTEDERLLWSRLSVFAGDLTLEAAETVCADEALPAHSILDALIGLVDKSVVVRREGEEATGYRLLDTIREYGLTRLAPAEEQLTRQRHRDHYAELARQYEREWTGDNQLARTRRLVREHANLRSALDFSLSSPEQGAVGLRMATDLWGYWAIAGLLTEGRHWFRRALEQAPEPTPDRVRALWLTVWFKDMQGAPDLPGAPDGRYELLAEARKIAEANADATGLAWVLTIEAHVRYFSGDMTRCAEDFAEARRQMEALDDQVALLITGFLAGLMHILAGDIPEGLLWCDDSLRRLAGVPGECWARGWALWDKSVGLWLKGDHQSSILCAAEGIRAKSAVHDIMGVAQFLEGFAWHAAEQGRYHRVAVLQGAADQLWRRGAKEARFGISVLHGLHETAAAHARAALGEHDFQDAFREGESLSLDEAVRRALSEEPPVPLPPQLSAAPDRAESLTAREREVAALVAKGLTNREIAERLVISKRTADAHVDHILTKLGLTSRAQVTAGAGAVVPR